MLGRAPEEFEQTAWGKMITITTETPEDKWEVEALYDLSFAPGREALSSYRLREGVSPVAELCLVARDADGILAAAIRFWPVALGEDSLPALLLGPIAVHPTRQGEGLGGQMMRTALSKATEIGWERVILIGDAPYYQRFGFEKQTGLRFPPPVNPERLLGKELVAGSLAGLTGAVSKVVKTTT